MPILTIEYFPEPGEPAPYEYYPPVMVIWDNGDVTILNQSEFPGVTARGYEQLTHVVRAFSLWRPGS